MALGFIPLPHEVIIEKASPELDEWGFPKADSEKEPQVVKAKITYNTTNEQILIATGEMIRYTAQILLEGFPDIEYQDFVTWQDSRGNVHRKNPVEIHYKVDLSGEVMAVRITV